MHKLDDFFFNSTKNSGTYRKNFYLRGESERLLKEAKDAVEREVEAKTDKMS